LLQLPTLYQHVLVRLPPLNGLLLALAQEPRRVSAVALAFAQVQLDKAVDDQWMEYRYLASFRV
jgi:hypothetical protein